MANETQSNLEVNDRIKIARQELTRTIASPGVSETQLVSRVVNLQNCLYASNLEPDIVYHELRVASEQAAEKARLSNFEEASNVLEEMKRGYEQTLDFVKKPEPSQKTANPAPTKTAAYAPMTRGKGEHSSSPLLPPTGTSKTEKPKEAPKSKEPTDPDNLPGPLKRSLELLKTSQEPMSKEQMAEKLHLSSGTVVCNISGLRNNGYDIESVKEGDRKKVLGYRLRQETPQQEDSQQAEGENQQ